MVSSSRSELFTRCATRTPNLVRRARAGSRTWCCLAIGRPRAPAGAPTVVPVRVALQIVSSALVAPFAPRPGHTRAMQSSGWIAACAVVALAAAPASADDSGPPFDQGRVGAVLTVGEQSSFGYNHIALA